MANEALTIQAEPRQASTKNEARRERRKGRLPGVLYGAKKEPRTISVDPKQIARVLHSQSGHNTVIAHITIVKEEVAPAADAVAAEAAATPAEPEVIKKGKQETEEGAAEAPAKEGKEKK